MNSLENSAKTSDKPASENENLPPIAEVIKTAENLESEQLDAKSEIVKKSLAEKATDAVFNLKLKAEEYFQKKGANYEGVVAKGALFFAVASVLMSAPQFNGAAMAAEENPTQKEYVLDKEGATPEVSQASIEKLNQEFSDFARDNQGERIAAAHPSQFAKADNHVESPKEKAKREAIVGFLQLSNISNGLSAKDAEEVYANNKTFLDENFKDILGGNGEATSSIDLLSEGGIMFKFSGNLENFGKIPEALMDNLKEIKDHPIKAITLQVLNMLVYHKVNNVLDEHTLREDDSIRGEQ